jgi:hypothetical protein
MFLIGVIVWRELVIGSDLRQYFPYSVVTKLSNAPCDHHTTASE